MADNLCSHPINKRTCFVFHDDGKQPRPWHGKGLGSPEALTPDEALVACQADFEVETSPVFTTGGPEGSLIMVPDRKAIVRVDRDAEGRELRTVLADVGADYEVLSYDEALEPFRLLFPGKRCIDTAGVLGRGEKFFASVRLSTDEIVPDDEVSRFLLIVAGHDSQTSWQALLADVRTVCQNTLNINLRGARNRVAVKHTRGVRIGLEAATEILLANEKHRQLALEAFRAMAGRECGAERVKKVLLALFPDALDVEGNVSPRSRAAAVRERIETLYDREAIGRELAGHSDFGLFNGICQWIDREQAPHAKGERWLRSTFAASAQDLRQRAFDVLTAPSVG